MSSKSKEGGVVVSVWHFLKEESSMISQSIGADRAVVVLGEMDIIYSYSSGLWYVQME